MTSPSLDPHEEPSTLESIRDRFSREWSHLKDMVRTKFDKLTDDDIAAVDGRYDELSNRLTKYYGYPQDRSDEEISRFVSEGGNSALYVNSGDEVQTGDHRGMGAEVGRNDRPSSIHR